MTIQNLKLNTEDKKFLLELAREAIEAKLESREVRIPETIPENLQEKRGAFVTLTIDGKLRGCIGHLLPTQALYQDVIENARAAAFDDPRFAPLTADEFQRIKIEISALDLPQKFASKSPQDLLNFLAKNRPGVILKKGQHRATFLPQVWEDLPEPAEFLSHLCLKAGLPPDEWARGVEIETYRVTRLGS